MLREGEGPGLQHPQWTSRQLAAAGSHDPSPLSWLLYSCTHPSPSTQLSLSRPHPGLPGSPVPDTRDRQMQAYAPPRGRSQTDPNYCKPPSFITNRCISPAKSQNRYSLQSLCAAGHMARLRQSWQRGRTGRQVCWPKPTKSPLISLHRFLWMGMGKFGGRKGKRGVLPHPHPASAPGQPLLQGSAGLLWGLGHLLGPLESVGDSVHVCVHCCLEMGQDKHMAH